jgi:hypothetical protein
VPLLHLLLVNSIHPYNPTRCQSSNGIFVWLGYQIHLLASPSNISEIENAVKELLPSAEIIGNAGISYLRLRIHKLTN